MNDNNIFYDFQFELFQKNKSYETTRFSEANTRIDQILEAYKRTPKRALELGSGMGFEAIALGNHGVQVVAIDYSKPCIDFSLALKEAHSSQVSFIHDSFYTSTLSESFDLIYYLDGFGVGSNADQALLLNNISKWLSDSGQCHIDVYNPNYWQKTACVSMKLSATTSRVYGYLEEEKAFSDTWTSAVDGRTGSQVLKCYILDEITELAENAGFKVVKVIPGGAMDYEQMVYHPEVALEACMMYRVVLERRGLSLIKSEEQIVTD